MNRTPYPAPPKGWLTVKEISKLTKISINRIYYITRQEQLPFLHYSHQKGGRRYGPEAILTFKEWAKS